MNDQANAEKDRLHVLQQNASNTHLSLHQKIRELTEELHSVYEREARLLKIVDKRDKQLDQVAGGRNIAVPSADQCSESDRGGNSLELDLLKQRYVALSRSKLGRLQLWYWRFKSGR
ncbi:hypothetical protein [Glutamicibacter soli]